jgi:hypothetical protein
MAEYSEGGQGSPWTVAPRSQSDSQDELRQRIRQTITCIKVSELKLLSNLLKRFEASLGEVRPFEHPQCW